MKKCKKNGEIHKCNSLNTKQVFPLSIEPFTLNNICFGHITKKKQLKNFLTISVNTG